MADLGSIGVKGNLARPLVISSKRYTLRCIVAGDRYFVAGAKDTSEGNPQPSLRMDALGSFRFRWQVLAGARTIQIQCKQAINLSPRPTMVIKANSDIGVNADVTVTAGSGAGYVTIGPETINPVSDGALWVELHNNLDYQIAVAPCYWDNLSTT